VSSVHYVCVYVRVCWYVRTMYEGVCVYVQTVYVGVCVNIQNSVCRCMCEYSKQCM
jgi:hypothetical protein